MGKRYARLCAWIEENIEETFSLYLDMETAAAGVKKKRYESWAMPRDGFYWAD